MNKYKVNDVGLTVDLKLIRILDIIPTSDNLTFYKVVSADREHQFFMTRIIPESEIKTIYGQARSALFEIFNPFLENVDEVQEEPDFSKMTTREILATGLTLTGGNPNNNS